MISCQIITCQILMCVIIICSNFFLIAYSTWKGQGMLTDPFMHDKLHLIVCTIKILILNKYPSSHLNV